MKNFVSCVCALCLFAEVFATTYYSQGSLSTNNLSSWNSNPTGGGSIPGSFTNPGDIFFIQNGHAMSTTAGWTIGSPTSILKIGNTGILHGNHAIFFDGTFQIENGGIYFHNNTASVSSSPGGSIFGGTESFAPSSNVEIKNWVNNTTTLPNSINWGNLLINYTSNIGGNWNQQGSLNSIQGNLNILNTGGANQEFQLTGNINTTLNIGGNLEVSNGVLMIKSESFSGTFAIVQVNGNLTVSGGTLNLGTVDYLPGNELRFKGNLSVSGSGTITSMNQFPFLVANGTFIQSLSSVNPINSGIKIALGSIVLLNSNLTLGNTRILVVAGTLNAGNFSINMTSGQLFVAGGILNSSGNMIMQNSSCTVCTGTGSFSSGWCLNTGNTGRLNYNSGAMVLSRSFSSSFNIGGAGSPGEVYLINQAKISFLGAPGVPANGSATLAPNSVLSFDETSLMEGDAFYNGNGGLLIIGSPQGITTTVTGSIGNIRVTTSRNYDNSGINSFEYKSSVQQETGNGLPSIIDGRLKINNTSSAGVTLTKATTIATGGGVDLLNGLLKTNNTFSLELRYNADMTGGSATSYIDGPLRKIGNENFTFHIGRAGLYSPVSMETMGSSDPTDVFTADYVSGNPKAVYGNSLTQYIDHISSVEYWVINGPPFRPKKLTFRITPYSNASVFSKLLVAYFDGNDWINYGNEGNTGTPTNGTIQITPSFFGPFTFGSLAPSHIICPGGTTSFSMTPAGPGYTYQWQVDIGNGFENIQNGPVYSGVATNALTLGNVPSSYYGYKYRCIATDGANSVTSEIQTIKFSVTWEGTSNSSWSNPSNWSCGIMPDQYTDVLVTSGGFQPVISSNTSCRSILLFSGTNLSIASGVNFEIKGRRAE